MANIATEGSQQLEDTHPKNSDQFWGGVFLLLVIIGIVMGTMSIVNWMTDDQRLPLSRLVIEGDLKQVQPQEIQTVLGSMPELGTFMTQDINELQQVISLLPWIKNVSIRKQWPDLVKVHIIEYKAQAIWNGSKLLDPDGNIFNGDPSVVSDDLINLYGPDAYSKDVLTAWEDSNKLIQPLGLSIQSVVLNDRRAWQIILNNGIRLELGKDIHANRLQRFVRLYQVLGEKSSQVSYIDLRYDTGAAIGWILEEDDSA